MHAKHAFLPVKCQDAVHYAVVSIGAMPSVLHFKYAGNAKARFCQGMWAEFLQRC